MTSLTPSLPALARVQLAMSQPTEELEIITSTACPVPWNPPLLRRPPDEPTRGGPGGDAPAPGGVGDPHVAGLPGAVAPAAAAAAAERADLRVAVTDGPI